VASMRALDQADLPVAGMRRMMKQLGQRLWRPGSPAGFDDRAERWAAPDALFRRIEAAQRLGARSGMLDARAIAPNVYPGLLSQDTKTALARAASPQQAVALMLASPEAMWR
jgi:uncharacterized protein (DUF1800 family)